MTTQTAMSELDLLKERATLMNITFHPSIGLSTLKERVNEALGTAPVFQQETKPIIPFGTVVETRAEKSIRIRKEATKLIRIRVSCMNPNKKAWEGEIFSISNNSIGTIKKFVPFDVDTGYHVPNVIYQHMRDRKYQHFIKVKLDGGRFVMKSKLSPEFSIDVMTPLTSQELKDLATRQALNHSID